MIIFDFLDYKKWVNDRISAMPKRGRGQYRRLAEQLNTSSAIVTQVFKGTRELTSEQAVLLCDFFGLSKIEQKYLLLIVNYSRAGSHRYKEILLEEIKELQKQAHEIKGRVKQDLELSEEAKATLYSNWYYMAIWSLTAISGFNTVDAISERLDLDRKKVTDALELLTKHGLVINNPTEGFRNGPSLFHLGSSSPHLARHHQNWRLQAFQKYEKSLSGNTFYTAPITLSRESARQLREKILVFISEAIERVKDSPSEELHCLCIDWFEI